LSIVSFLNVASLFLMACSETPLASLYAKVPFVHHFLMD